MSTSKNNFYEFSGFVNRIMELKGLRFEKDVAELLGFKPVAFNERKKRNSIPTDRLRLFCQEEGLNYEWMLTGRGEMFLEGEGEKGIKETANPADISTINVYAIAGAGMPHSLTDYDSIETISLPARFIKPNITPIKIRGHSMEPMIFNGAYVGIDKEDRQLVSGEVYAVWLPYEGAVVKRLYMAADSIVVKSDNPSFPELSIPINQVGDNFILGRVKWVLQEIAQEG